MAASISDSIRCAPVTRPYRRWLALSAALLLHLLLIGIVASWQFTPMPAERTSLDVVLVTRPAEEPVEVEAIADTDQEAAGQEETAEAPAEQRSVPIDELPHLEAPDSSAAPAASAERPADEPEVAEEGPAEAAEESEAQPQAEPQSAPRRRNHRRSRLPQHLRHRGATCWPRPPAASVSRNSMPTSRAKLATHRVPPPSGPPRHAISMTGPAASRITATGFIPPRAICMDSCAFA
ncbi:hypothetical protein [Billgrantia tianxiuensis]|uniref:hypothetical protein n=1 Tax=Billgrantia tianxiuensis TaxID=2497861 RepID=UPI001F1F57D2|nr:hypothetical protein [Halomonas tianxiuensis]